MSSLVLSGLPLLLPSIRCLCILQGLLAKFGGAVLHLLKAVLESGRLSNGSHPQCEGSCAVALPALGLHALSMLVEALGW